MSKKDRELEVIRGVLRTHKEINTKFGADKVQEYRDRLCEKCSWLPANCYLLPITIVGEDCPYFKSKAKVKEVKK